MIDDMIKLMKVHIFLGSTINVFRFFYQPHKYVKVMDIDDVSVLF